MNPPSFWPEGALVAVVIAEGLGPSMGGLGPVLDYRAPQGGVGLGAFVEVPLGPRKLVGVVWGAGQGGYDPAKIRPIIRQLDAVPLQPAMQQFLQRAADYTLTPLSQMLRLATRAPGLEDGPAMRKLYRPGPVPTRLTEARAKVMAVFDDPDVTGALTARELATRAEVSAAVVRGLITQGCLLEEEAPRDLPWPRLDPDAKPVRLAGAQIEAAAGLVSAVAERAFSATLLRGVTGSGKTEVYLEAVAECLRQGRQALVLLPEIALTSEFLNRVEARFGTRPAEWHSGMSMTERRRLWRMASEGGVQFVAGARSALFLPFQNLGLIVVDEEHDSSYKQEEGVIYNARDMAVLRASLEGAAVVLASATPSLETWHNAKIGKYRRIDLGARYGVAELPEMRTIDMRAQKLKSDHWISEPLKQEIAKRLEAGEQSLLFVNRRGYAPVTLCRACGHQIGCDDCDARMVEHRFPNRLMCHQCGASKPMPQICPHCQVEGKLAAIGPGVERLAEEAQEAFPHARVAILSSDLFSTPKALKAQIELIASGGADIIIGTQIVAKGHNFPLLTLVGVIDADLGLQGSDLRAAERTFQLMRQVAGRAGRSERRGTALLQSHQPEHPVIRAILEGDEEAFLEAESNERRVAGSPPWGRMAGIILSAPTPEPAFAFGAELVRRDGPLRAVGAEVFGPAPAPIARLRGRHRVRLLVKAPRQVALQGALKAWIGQLRLPAGVRLAVDIDPQSFL